MSLAKLYWCLCFLSPCFHFGLRPCFELRLRSPAMTFPDIVGQECLSGYSSSHLVLTCGKHFHRFYIFITISQYCFFWFGFILFTKLCPASFWRMPLSCSLHEHSCPQFKNVIPPQLNFYSECSDSLRLSGWVEIDFILHLNKSKRVRPWKLYAGCNEYDWSFWDKQPTS